MNIDKNREFKEKVIDNDFNLKFQSTKISNYIDKLQQENAKLKEIIEEKIYLYNKLEIESKWLIVDLQQRKDKAKEYIKLKNKQEQKKKRPYGFEKNVYSLETKEVEE